MVSFVIARTSVTELMVHCRRCHMCSSLALERFGRYTVPSHGRTVSLSAIAKSFPSIPSSSLIPATIKFHFMARVPRVTVNLVLPRHSSARRPITWSVHLLYDPTTSRSKQPGSTPWILCRPGSPSIRPGRYRPFPTMTSFSRVSFCCTPSRSVLFDGTSDIQFCLP